MATSLGLQPSELNFIDSDSTFGPFAVQKNEDSRSELSHITKREDSLVSMSLFCGADQS